MKKLHTFGLLERPQAILLQEILVKEGVECVVRNADLSLALGEIPMTECFPELWVVDDEAYPRAKLLLEGWLKEGGENEESWECPECGEVLDGRFGACWSCGRLRD